MALDNAVITSKPKILIVDDSQMNRMILSDILSDEADIIEAANGIEAVATLRRNSSDIALVLLDIVMPEMDGFEVLAIMNKYNWINDIPVIMISAETTPSSVERAYNLGVTDYISRPFDSLVVHRRVSNTLMLYAKQRRLVNLVADQIYEKEKSNSLMINILSHIVEFRNGESGLHVLHISVITEILLKRLIQKTDKYNLTNADISMISTASALHDIGKIAIPGEILNKPGRFTPEEFNVMKTHSAIGASMLEQTPFYHDEALVKIAYQICRWHHERYNGGGYPDGLKGEEIPISAQVVSVADVYDALTSERVYKPAYSHEKALEMIRNGECGSFNPLLLECLGDCSEIIRQEMQTNSPDTTKKKELDNIANEMVEHVELSAAERTLRQLEYERIKYDFATSTSPEIHFEVSSTPHMLMLSKRDADRLGIEPNILNPENSDEFLNLIGRETYRSLVVSLHKTAPTDPIITQDCDITVKGEKRHCQLICRAMWSSDNIPKYTGTIGKIIDL